jgi:hypothetical protein
MGKNCIDKKISVVTGEQEPCVSINCVQNPRMYVAKAIDSLAISKAFNDPPLSSDLILIPNMTLVVPFAGNWSACFNSYIVPGTVLSQDNFTYTIFLNGAEITVSRRKVNSSGTGIVSKKYIIYTSTSLFTVGVPGVIEVRGCLQLAAVNTCNIATRTLTLYRLP